MSIKPSGGPAPARWFFFARDNALNNPVRGFTVIELVILIVIIGVLAAVIAPRWFQADLELHGAAQQLKNDIRYVQGLAMAHGQRHRIYFNAGDYRLRDNAGVDVPHPLTPTTAIVPYSSAGNVSMSSSSFNLSYLAFDGLGRPYNGTILLGAATTVVLGQNGGTARTLSIAPQTGFVTVSP